MEKSKIQAMPAEFKSLEEAAEFWDTHSLADYEDLQTHVEFEVELKSAKNYFAVEKELSDTIGNLARLKGILPETLVNLWLKEKLQEEFSNQDMRIIHT